MRLALVMKRALVIAWLVAWGAIAHAQPVLQGGIKQVQHDSSMTGAGTTASSLGIVHCVTIGHVLQWNGSAWACAAAGGSVADGDKGDITVTGSGVTWTVDADSITYAKLQNISATDRVLCRDTAGAGDAEECTIGGGLEFTGSVGLQRSALTGDVTASAGSNATTIANSAVTLAKMADLAQSTIIGRAAGAGTGAPTALTATQATAILNLATTSVKGLAPVLSNVSTQFLDGTGAYSTPAYSSLSGAFSTSNVIPKGNGTGLASSSLTDDGTTVSTAEKVAVLPTGGAPTSLAGGNPGQLYVVHQGSNFGAVVARPTNDTGGANLSFYKTRATDAATKTAVASGDTIGNLWWQAATDSSTVQQGAAILAKVNGTVSTSALPTQLEFQTTAAATPTTRLTIAANGDSTFANALTSTGDFTVGASKFTVAAASGNTAVAGTLGVTGQLTLPRAAGVGPVLSWKQTGQVEWQLYQQASTDPFKIWNATTGDVCTISTAGALDCLSLKAGGTSVVTTANVSGTTGTIPKFTGANAVGNSSVIDGGAGDIRATKVSSVARLKIGDDADLSTNAQNGYSLLTYSDGNNYFDSKVQSGLSTLFRTGAGAESGSARTWLTVTGSTGAAAFAGNVTLGAATTNAHTINGTTTFNVNTSTGIGPLVSGAIADVAIQLTSSASGGRTFLLGSGATASAAPNSFYIYDSTGSTTRAKFGATATTINNLATDTLAIHGVTTTDAGVTVGGNLILSQASDDYIFGSLATSTGNQGMNIDSAGTGEVRINSNQGGITSAGTGGLGVYGGANGSTRQVWLKANGDVVTLGNTTLGDADTDTLTERGAATFRYDSGSPGSAPVTVANRGIDAATDGVYIRGSLASGGATGIDATYIKTEAENASYATTGADASLWFGTSIDAATPAERFRIRSTGAIQIGDTGTAAVGDGVDVVTIGQTGTGQTLNGQGLLKLSDTGTYIGNSTTRTKSYGLKIDRAAACSDCTVANSKKHDDVGLWIDMNGDQVGDNAVYDIAIQQKRGDNWLNTDTTTGQTTNFGGGARANGTYGFVSSKIQAFNSALTTTPSGATTDTGFDTWAIDAGNLHVLSNGGVLYLNDSLNDPIVIGRTAGGSTTIASPTVAIGADTSSAISFTNGPSGINGPDGKHIEYVEDFLYLDSPTNTANLAGWWSQGLSSATASMTTNTSAVRPGLVTYSTAASATARATGTMGEIVDFGAVSTTKTEMVVNIPTLSTSAEEFQFIFGFDDARTTVQQVDGCYFVYDRAGTLTDPTTGDATGTPGDFWQIWSSSNSTRTGFILNTTSAAEDSFARVNSPVAAGTLPDTNTYRLKVVYEPTKCRFYINGVEVGRLTTHIPSGSTRLTSPGFIFIKSVGTTARTAVIDWWSWSEDLSAAR